MLFVQYVDFLPVFLLVLHKTKIFCPEICDIGLFLSSFCTIFPGILVQNDDFLYYGNFSKNTIC